jgi:hypothetical protein
VPSMASNSAASKPFAWWLTREQIGLCLSERYRVPKELPPRLLKLVNKLQAVEGNQDNQELSLGLYHARNAIGAFSLWAETTRQVLVAKLGIPQPEKTPRPPVGEIPMAIFIETVTPLPQYRRQQLLELVLPSVLTIQAGMKHQRRAFHRAA